MSSIIILVLLFVDGLIFGLAARKGIGSVALIVIGLILAGFIGLGIPFLDPSTFITRLQNFIISLANIFPAVIYAFPVLWIVGFIAGLFV